MAAQPQQESRHKFDLVIGQGNAGQFDRMEIFHFDPLRNHGRLELKVSKLGSLPADLVRILILLPFHFLFDRLARPTLTVLHSGGP